MSKKSKHQAQTAAEPQRTRGVAGYLIGGALGVVVLAILALITHKPAVGAILEYPQLTVLVELDDLGDPTTRDALTRLQRELEALGLAVRGPSSFPVLLPAADDALPRAKRLDALTADELQTARPYFAAGGYLVPRVYSEDLKTAILRAAPAKGGRFLPGTRREVERVLDAFRTEGVFTGLWPYSYDLRLVDPEAQARTNVVFGVQTANVLLVAEPGKLQDVSTLLALDSAADVLKNQNLRSVVTPGSWYRYAEAVRNRDPKLVASKMAPEVAAALAKLATDSADPSLVYSNGASAMVEVTTQAEGKENLDLCWFVAANLNSVKGVKAVVERERD